MKERTLIFIFFFFGLLLLFSRNPQGDFVSRFFRGGGEDDSAVLKREIVSLRSQIAQISGMKSTAPSSGSDGVVAPVFSSYPFNFKKEVLVEAGADKGIKEGQAVIMKGESGGRVLLGYVAQVYEDASRVRTIFDTRWSSAVRVGDKGAQALLSGGLQPELSLIPKDAQVNSGDIVYSADPKFPYGIGIGTVKDLQIAKEQAFQKASISFSYDLEKVRNVIILTEYVAPGSRE